MYRFQFGQFFESGWAYLSSFLKRFNIPSIALSCVLIATLVVCFYHFFKPMPEKIEKT